MSAQIVLGHFAEPNYVWEAELLKELLIEVLEDEKNGREHRIRQEVPKRLGPYFTKANPSGMIVFRVRDGKVIVDIFRPFMRHGISDAIMKQLADLKPTGTGILIDTGKRTPAKVYRTTWIRGNLPFAPYRSPVVLAGRIGAFRAWRARVEAKETK